MLFASKMTIWTQDWEEVKVFLMSHVGVRSNGSNGANTQHHFEINKISLIAGMLYWVLSAVQV